ENTTTGGFPDARGYRIDCRDPEQITFPSRSTVKQFQVDWAGGAWKMPRAITADGSPSQIRIEGDEDHAVLSGTLVHELPSALKNITVVVVLGQKPITVHDANPGQAAFLPNARAVDLPNPWAPGDL